MTSNSYIPTSGRQYQSDLDRLHAFIFVLFLYIFDVFSSVDSWQRKQENRWDELNKLTISDITVLEI